MAYIDDIYALLPTNGTGEISAADQRDSFTLMYNNIGKLISQTQGINTGYRIYSTDYTNYGPIGNIAYDLSTHVAPDIQNGATHNYSFVQGEGSRSSSFGSTNLGYYNNPQINSIFEIGIGTAALRMNAFEVYKDGTVTSPEVTNANIDLRGPKTFITKEYLDSNFVVTSTSTSFTGNGSNLVFVVPAAPYIEVFNKGIKEQPTAAYSVVTDVVNSTVTFVSAPDSGAWIEIISQG